MIFHKYPTRRKKNGFAYVKYTTECNNYAVEKSTWQGESDELPPVWRAMRNDGSFWGIVSRHRTRPAAERALRGVTR